MSWIDRLDRKIGRFAVPNLTLFLIAGQVLAYVASAMPVAGGAPLAANIALIPDQVVAGEWWRVVTFLFAPPTSNIVFAFISWYLFYLMGTALEANWGAFRYNVYLLLGYVASIVMAFVAYFVAGIVGETASNMFLYSTVYLAFARLYPDFVLYIMFVLPVKIRWLAMLTWIFYGVTVLFTPISLPAAMVVAAVFNYLVFFGRDILRDMKHRHRKMQFQSRALQGGKKQGRKMAHVCHVCGRSSLDSPREPFRYCSECGGSYCYCPDHINDHEHVMEVAPK